MQQIKLFKGVESEMEDLEAQVNAWIRKNRTEVISVVGNIAPQSPARNALESFPVSDILIVVTYEAKNG